MWKTEVVALFQHYAIKSKVGNPPVLEEISALILDHALDPNFDRGSPSVLSNQSEQESW